MRSIWKGAISFGLVNIPVNLYSASQEKEFSFTMLHKKDNSPIRYARICKAEEKEVPWKDIVKAYEYEPGEYVVFNDEDFVKADLQRSKTIEIIHFINEDEIDSIFYVKPYYLEPQKNAEKTYNLLCEALRKSKKVGLAKYVLRNREHLGVVKIHDNMIVLNELRYLNELKVADEIKIPQTNKELKKEIDMAVQLIDQQTKPFEPAAYKDTYSEEIKKIIKQKSKGKAIHPKTSEPKSTKVQDIMSLLKASLEEPAKPKRKPKTKTA